MSGGAILRQLTAENLGERPHLDHKLGDQAALEY
jgi:hypothetical protein